ncbi:MAG TPA: fumarylacetoacetate hydrolase family protein [Chryseosolibacter sp.]
MLLYKTRNGIVIGDDGKFYATENRDWDSLINDDQLYKNLRSLVAGLKPLNKTEVLVESEILAPIGQQEVWACGVTYYRSKVGRQEESKSSGGSDFYARVYEAERPEIFFKATPHRVVGHLGKVRIRKDSAWDVPEPELTLVVTTSGKIVGYTIGNDMSSRSIEGENPLYLPQAKTYDGAAAIGPCIYVTDKPLDKSTGIHLEIHRAGKVVFTGDVTIDQIVRKFEDLVSFLYRECSFPAGAFVMTGTGIVPSSDFTLKKNDEIRITIEPIGTLINTVA